MCEREDDKKQIHTFLLDLWFIFLTIGYLYVFAFTTSTNDRRCLVATTQLSRFQILVRMLATSFGQLETLTGASFRIDDIVEGENRSGDIVGGRRQVHAQSVIAGVKHVQAGQFCKKNVDGFCFRSNDDRLRTESYVPLISMVYGGQRAG